MYLSKEGRKNKKKVKIKGILMEKPEKRNKQESPGRGGGVCSLGEESRKQRRSEEMAARKWERRTNGRSKVRNSRKCVIRE